MARNATSNAFIAAKKKREEYNLLGLQKQTYDGKIDNSFEEQHHHLLSCLEHATVIIFFLNFFIIQLRILILIFCCCWYLKDREFIEIDSNLSNFNNQLLQLKLKKSDGLFESKLLHDLLNCFCNQRKLISENSNIENSNPNEEKVYSFFSSNFCYCLLISYYKEYTTIFFVVIFAL